MNTVKDLVKTISSDLSQKSSSKKDEITIMQAMLNDTSYKVDVYKKDGVDSVYCPAEDIRDMTAGIIAATTKISQAEARTLADNYQFTKKDAETQINVSKEFVNTYLATGRKMPLGGRVDSNISLQEKIVPAGIHSFPKKIGTDAKGKDVYQSTETKVAAHKGIKISSPCPSWVK